MPAESLAIAVNPVVPPSNVVEVYGYDVMAFGAVGDGTTDDTKAFQSAINAGNVIISAPSVSYKILTTVDIPANRTIYAHNNATILVSPSSLYSGAFRCVGSNINIIGVNFKGNGTSTACTSSNGSDNGAAIRGTAVSNIQISNCSFELFVCTNDDDSIIGFSDSQCVKIHNNSFKVTNVNGTDINLSYSVGACIITENHSQSECDKFIHISSYENSETIDATSNISKTAHHIISKNIFISKGGIGNTTNTQYGILAHVAGGVSYAIITDNILVNGTRHGICLQGSATIGSASGPNIVNGNIIRYFGGGENKTNYWGYNSGIKVEVMNGSVIDGNLIEYSGYNVDGSARSYKAAGIDIIRAMKNVKIINNIIQNCSGGGIMLNPEFIATASTYNMENIDISGNIITGNGDIQLLITNRLNVSINMIRITVSDNTFSSTEDERALVAIDNNGKYDPLITNNKFVGNYNAGAGTNQIGLAIRTSGTSITRIDYNIFDNLYIGSGRRDVPANGLGTWPLAEDSTHREIGTLIRYSNNAFESCATGIIAEFASANEIAFVEPSNSFKSVTTVPAKQLYSPSASNQVYYGKVAGLDASNNILIELIIDVTTPIPTTTQYYQGDRVLYTNPAAAGNIGAVCVTSGTPGTWKTYGVIAA